MEENNLELDQSFWDNRYINKETGWDLGGVSTPLKNYFDQLTDKNIQIVIPGCGNAHEAEYLFKNGFRNVYLIDLSPTALTQFKDRVPEFIDDHLICEDFFTHQGQYDLMVEQTFFCAINPSLRRNYAHHACQILKPKGKLVGLLFNEELNSEHPPFGGHKEEYLSYFSPFFDVEIMKPANNSIAPRRGRELFIKMIKK